MSEQLSNETLKLVTIRPSRPFRIGNGTFTSIVNRIPLSVGNINLCLQEKAFVIEHLVGNKEVALDFVNYNQVNGQSILPSGAIEYVRDPNASKPEVEMVDEDRNRRVINKASKAATQPIIHIDLEEQKKAEEAARIKAEEEAKAREAKRKAKEAAEATRAYQQQRDEQERKKAIEAILAREQAKKEKAATAPIPAKVASNASPAAIKDGFTVAPKATIATEESPVSVDTSANVNVEVPAIVDTTDPIDTMSVDDLRKMVDTIDWTSVPDYNHVDWDKDDIGVVKAKLKAVKANSETKLVEEPKSDLTKSDRQDSKKTKFDHKRK